LRRAPDFARAVVTETDVNRILRPLILVLAAIYFLVDAIFMTVAGPVADWIAGRFAFGRLRGWIVSLPPYPTLALFAVPLIVLEPVKPVAAYLAATGHMALGLSVLVVGEVLKLVLVERLFSVSRDKLMSIAAFAWAYGRVLQGINWLQSFEAWQTVRRRWRVVQYTIRSRVRKARTVWRRECILFQPR
jgi:hypothetical protein